MTSIYRFSFLAVCVTAVFTGLSGCGGPGVETKEIVVKSSNDPLYEPRSILQRYVDGQALGSEVEGFDQMVAKVREVDSERADALEKGFAEIKTASPGQVKSLAEKLLKEIQPKMVMSSPEEAESDAVGESAEN